MKRKKIPKRILAGIGSIGMALAMFAPLSAFAASSYEPISGTQTTFNKFLIMDSGDSVPNATFQFTVTPGTAIPASAGKMQILAGVGSPSIADVTFSSTDSTSTTTTGLTDITRTQADRAGTAGTDTVQLDAGEKFATKTATIDFSSVSFPEPGIYRYVINETASASHTASGIIHDTDTDRILDVYVTDNNGALVVSGYVMHTTAGDVTIGVNNGSAGGELADKSDGFTNEITSKDLKIEHEVSGNQASRDKYFEYTLKCTDVADSDVFIVSIAADSDNTTNDGNADATSGNNAATIAANANKPNPTQITGADLKSENGVKFYLQHGQSVVIRGLPTNANYTVTVNPEDYKMTTKSGATNSGIIGTVAGDSKIAIAGFTTARSGVIPTGVFLASGLGFGIVVIGAGGLIITRNRRQDDEDFGE